ncbi:variable large family protein (plasmid) [Borreliella andersonii]|uniref:Variable large family protein n=1 Tax=Borrelia andersonii TaxID=42109 RepID=A0ACD5G665_BORAD
MKAIVDAAVKAGGWIKEMHKAVEDIAKAGKGGSDPIANVAAGNAANNGAGNAAGAMANKDSVTGIAKGMKAIVDAAGTSAGKRANAATNAVEAAIGAAGAAGGAGQAFVADMQNKNDQIAAAIVAGTKADAGSVTGIAKGMKAIVDAAVKAGGWIKEMHKAVEDTAKAGEGGSDPIANVAAGNAANNGAGNAAGAMANKDSVTGIAKGMKAIVDAAGKAGVEFKPAGAEGAGGNNDAAGKLFVSGAGDANNGADNDAANAQKAAAEAGKAVAVLRGLAKSGKFANVGAGGEAAHGKVVRRCTKQLRILLKLVQVVMNQLRILLMVVLVMLLLMLVRRLMRVVLLGLLRG